MIDKEVFRELLRESFQDFDLLDYDYSVKFTLGVLLTNKDGSIKSYYAYDNYIKLYNCNLKISAVTYKDL